MDKKEIDGQGKENTWPLLLVRGQEATSIQIQIPMMPRYHDMVTNPMATDPTLLATLSTDSRATKEEASILV